MHAYVQEFTTLTLQIPNLTDEDMLFHFMDRMQSWARTEFECQPVRTIGLPIRLAEALKDFNNGNPNKAGGDDV